MTRAQQQTEKMRLVKDLFRLKHLAKSCTQQSQRVAYEIKYNDLKQLLQERMG